MSFVFWRIMPDGTAEPTTDDLEVNAGVSLYYGTPEGAIIHAGVLACAFKRKSEMTYCAKTFFTTGEKVETGLVTTTTITAEPERRAEKGEIS